MAARLRVAAVALLLLGVSHQQKPSQSVYSLLCTGVITDTIGVKEYTKIRRMALQDDSLSMEIEYGIRAHSLVQGPALNLLATDGVGYALDGKPVVTIRPLTNSTHMIVLISLSGLRRGKHRIAIGLGDRSGELEEDNAYCFSTPGRFDLQGNLYL
jgi:hypothetical protein